MKRAKAFTLVELLVVIAIIGLLSTVVLISTKGLRNKANIAKNIVFDRQVESTLGAYLVGRWTFDEGEGIIAHNTSGWNNHGTLGQDSCIPGEGYCPAWKCTSEDKENTASGTGCSLYFDGVNDYVEVPHHNNQLLIQGGTISAWIRPKGWGGYGAGRIIDKSTSVNSHNGFHLYLGHSAKNLVFNINAENTASSAENSIILNDQWYHIVVTWESNSLTTFYINNTVSGIPKTTGNPLEITTANPLAIGNRSTATDRAFDGLIDEVKIYEKALSFTEIQYEYYAGLDRLLAKGLIDQEEYQDRLVSR